MLPSTINPVPTVKSDMMRMTSATFVRMPSTVWMTEVRSSAETFWKFRHDRVLQLRRGSRRRHTADENIESRRIFQNAGRKDDEEVGLKTFPIDLAQTRDARFDLHALNIEDKRIPNR